MESKWVYIYEVGGSLPEPGQLVFLKMCNGTVLDEDMYALGVIIREKESEPAGYRWLKLNMQKGIYEEFPLPLVEMNGGSFDTIAAWRPAVWGDK